MTASQMQTMQWLHLALQHELIITHFLICLNNGIADQLWSVHILIIMTAMVDDLTFSDSKKQKKIKNKHWPLNLLRVRLTSS